MQRDPFAGSRAGSVVRLTFVLLALCAGRVWSQAAKLQFTNPTGNMKISTTVSGAGTGLPSASDATGTYTLRAGNSAPLKLVAHVTMPAGLTLTVNLAPIAGSVGVGAVTLSTTDQTVLTNINTSSNTTGSMTYTLNATAAAGVFSPSTTRVVTYTLVSYP